MKNYVKNIVAATLGIIGVMFTAKFIFEVSPKAYANTQMTMPTPVDFGGNYMFDYSSVHVPSQDKTYYECLVWDKSTGESRLFYFNYTEKTFQAYGANVQIPKTTFDGGGSIMMDYTSVHVPSQDKTYYECLVWDTYTGESKLYYFNYTDKLFKAYEDNVQLPKPGFSIAGGQVLMDYTSVHVPSQDKTYYEVVMWNTLTGESEMYYYNYTDKRFVRYGNNVQIPGNPLD